MKDSILKYLFLAGLMAILASCSKTDDITNDENNGNQSILDLNIPDGFQFETTREIEVALTAKNSNSEPFHNLRFQIFNNAPNRGGELILQGATGNDGTFLSSLTLPYQMDSLYVTSNYAGIAGEMLEVGGGILAYEYNQKKRVPHKTGGRAVKDALFKATFDQDVQGFESYRDDGELSIKHSSHPDNPLDNGPGGPGDAFMWGFDTEGGLRSFEVSGEFHGNIYGNYIAYDYYVGNTAEVQPIQSNVGDIRITDGNKVLSVDFMETMPHEINGGWQTLYVKLDETATTGSGWKIGGMNTFTTGTGTQTLGDSDATDEEIQNILSNVSRILFAPEAQNGSYYADGYGPEFIAVDNVGLYESFEDIQIREQGEEPEDTDGDGVSDDTDDYPEDPERAFNNYSPSENEYGTLAYEDLWPSKGDYDFNDLVIDYRFNKITNADNKVVDLEGDFVIQAIGAGYENGFAFTLPLNPSSVDNVEGQVMNSGYINLSSNGTEASQTNTVIPVFENAYDVMDAGGSFVNTLPDQEYVEPVEFNVSVHFANPVSSENLGSAPYNPFIIADSERGHEVHLSGKQPTDLADEAVFGSEFDDTTPSENKYYQSEGNLPWAIHIPVSFAYPKENISIESAHLKFADWATSGGTEYQDWYEDKPGYRNNTKIYQKP